MTGVEIGVEIDAGTCAVTGSWIDADTGVCIGSVGVGLTVTEAGVGRTGCDGMEEGVLAVSDIESRKGGVGRIDCAGCEAVGLEDKGEEREKSCSLNKT